MKGRHPLISYIGTMALAACASTGAGHVDGAPPRFTLVAEPNDAQKRFDLRLVSTDIRPLCLTAEQWPSPSGKVESGGARAVLIMNAQRFPASNANFGYCPGGCGQLRVEPGNDLNGFVGYAEFGDERLIASTPDKTLRFNVQPYLCR